MAKKNVADCGEIRANRIVLVDGSGNQRIVMQLVNDQPSIMLIGLNGKVQVRLSIDGGNYDTAGLLLASPNGNTFGHFSVLGDASTEGVASLEFGGGDKRFVACTNLPGQLPTLNLIDESGSTVAHLPTAIPKKAANAKKKSKSKKAVKSKGGKSK